MGLFGRVEKLFPVKSEFVHGQTDPPETLDDISLLSMTATFSPQISQCDASHHLYVHSK